MNNSGFDKPPAPAPAQPLALPAFAQARLDNGLQVAAVTRRAVPLVTAALLVEAGSLLDPPGKAGLAALAFTLMGKGTRPGGRERDAAAIAIAAESLGGSLEIDTGGRASRIAMTVPADRLDAALALISEVLRAPSFPADELERSRAQSLDLIKLNLSDPAALAGLLARRLYWGDTPNGVVTTAASLRRLRREDIVAFHRRQVMRPERAMLVLAGDIDLPAAQALAQKHFGRWPQDRMAAPVTPVVAPRPLPPSALLLDLPGAGQGAVVVVAPYAAFGNEPRQRAALHAGAVANGVLGGGYSSRINQEVRIKRGLSYGASSEAETQAGGGMLTAFAQTKNASVGEVATLLAGEIAKLAQQDVPAPELAARTAVLVGDFGRGLETTAGLAGIAAEQLLRRRALAELQQLPEELLAVDAARVRAFAAEYWPPGALRTVIVADLKEAGADALRRQFPLAWQIRAAELDLGAPTLLAARRTATRR